MAESNRTPDSSVGDWDDYMSAKKSKLEEQFLIEAAKTDVKENIFKGTSIFVNGYSIPTADDLRRLMMEYGGVYHHYYRNGRTTYMIASNLPVVKIKQYKNSSIKILKPAWVTDSIKARKMLDFRPYLLLSDSSSKIHFQKTPKQVVSFADNTNDIASETVPSEPVTALSSPLKDANHSASDKSPKTLKGRKTASDENFLEEFYSNSRLHHISTMGATFKQYVNELRSKNNNEFPARERLKNTKINNPNLQGGDSSNTESCIMHIDMDCFFVSVGLRKHPHLKSVPVVVTHAKGNKTRVNNGENRKAEFSLHEKRNKKRYEERDGEYKPWFTDIGETDSMSEIASCSYEARKLGIKNGMLLGQAFKLCPTLKTIPYDFDGYKEVSYALYNHIASYTLDIEAVSCDEMFVDCSAILSYTNVGVLEFATILRNEIKEITGCSCSTGFGSNRLIARLATKKAKPDGQYFVPADDAKHFIEDFQVSDLPGIGRSIAAKLNNMEVKICKDLQNVPLSHLQQEFGMKAGLTLHRHSFGEDDRPLNFCHQRKSVSAEVNYGIRFENYIEAEAFLKTLSSEVENRLNVIGSRGKSITVKLMVKTEDAPKETAKFLGHGICNYITKTVSLLEATCDSAVIFREVMKIIQNLNIRPPDMRGIGIQMSRLENRKNIPVSSGKIDKFIIKTRKENPVYDTLVNDSVDRNVADCDENSSETTVDGSASSKVFDESEYDVSFSQIDPNYLAALPENIRLEVVSSSKKKSKSTGHAMFDDVTNEDDAHCSFIIKENGVPKLNPSAPTTEIVKSIMAWLSAEKIPQDCDLKILSDYVQQLILKKEYESVNFVNDSFQRLVSHNNAGVEWKNAYLKLKQIIRETMRSSY